ncbi:MAG TPA: hypothetical protein VIG69_11435 [Candidatus Methylomirabilis sp.]|jgi:hypothetical protein
MVTGMGRFDDRLDASAYAHDEPFLVGLIAPGTKPEWASASAQQVAYVPERIMLRIHALGSGYELHAIRNLSTTKPNRLYRLQAQNLMAELEFLIAVTNDPVLQEHSRAIIGVAYRCAASGTETELLIEGP